MPGSQQQSANPSVIYRPKMGRCQDPPLKPVHLQAVNRCLFQAHVFLPGISFSETSESRPGKVPSQHFDNEGQFFCWLPLKGSLGTISVTGSSASRHAFLFPFSFGFLLFFFFLQRFIVQSTWLIQYSLHSSQAAVWLASECILSWYVLNCCDLP